MPIDMATWQPWRKLDHGDELRRTLLKRQRREPMREGALKFNRRQRNPWELELSWARYALLRRGPPSIDASSPMVPSGSASASRCAG